MGDPAQAVEGAVVLDAVTKRYGSVVAVDELSVEVQAGEFLSLLGPSGCGKTTTLRMLAGFEHPDAGRIQISGRDLAGVPAHKRPVNTVFQSYSLFPHLSVAQNVAYGLQQKRVPRAEVGQRVAEVLDMVQMRAYAERRPNQLSGGQQQRIALARALVNRPSVLLLDEPLGALDRQLREQMQLELKLLQSRLGVTFIFVTHDQSEALAMSDRIAIMRHGRIEQLADATTIYETPATAYVAGFVGQQNFLRGKASGESGQVDTAWGRMRSARHAPPVAAGAAVTAAVRPESVEIDLAGSAEDAAENSVTGTLIGISHLGETIQFVVQVDPQLAVLARRPTPQAPHLTTGQRVRAFWPAERVLLFADDPTTTE